MTSTITCACGRVLNISSYLNADLQLIADDLAAKLTNAESEVTRVTKTLTLTYAALHKATAEYERLREIIARHDVE